MTTCLTPWLTYKITNTHHFAFIHQDFFVLKLLETHFNFSHSLFAGNQQQLPTATPALTTTAPFEVTSAASSIHHSIATPQSPVSSTTDRNKHLVTSSSGSSYSRIPVTTKPLNHHELISRYSSPSLQFSSTTERPGIHPDCPGVCVKMEYARFCGNIMSNGICNSSREACCLQSEITLKESENLTKPLITSQTTMNMLQHKLKPVMAEIQPVIVSTSIDFPDDRSKNKPSAEAWRRPFDRNLTREDFSHVTHKTQTPTSTSTTTQTSTTPMAETTTTPAPLIAMDDCEGTCVAPLFALLCDEVAKDKYCPNGGQCCFNREITTTTPPIPSCPGTCIPVFFSGAFCNRPAELIPKTSDCMSGTICCAEKPGGSSDEDGSSTNTMNENSALDDDEDLSGMPVHPPPQINRPVPKPLLPPPNLMYGPFPSRIHPQSGHPHHNMPAYPYTNFPAGHPAVHRPMRPPNMPPFLNHGPTGQRPLPPQNHGQYSPSIPGPVINSGESDSRPTATALSPQFAEPPPKCPSVCLTPLLKFTCFGSNVLYPTFQCQSPEEICCAPVKEVQQFEASLMKNFLPNNMQEIKQHLQPNVIPNFLQQHGVIGPQRPPHLQIHNERPMQHPLQHMQSHPHDQRPHHTQIHHTRDGLPPKHLHSPQKVMHPSHPQVFVHHHDPAKKHHSVSSPASHVVLQTQNLPPTEPTVSFNSPITGNNNIHAVTSNSWLSTTASPSLLNSTALISSLNSLFTSNHSSSSPTTPSTLITVTSTEAPLYSTTPIDSIPGKYTHFLSLTVSSITSFGCSFCSSSSKDNDLWSQRSQ